MSEKIAAGQKIVGTSRGWNDNKLKPITDHHVGETLIIRLNDSSNGITHSDNDLGIDYSIDLTWMRCGGTICATTGKYKNADIHSWKEI